MTDLANQNSVVQSLVTLFENTTIIDRRERPSHGYRAVHIVVNHGGKLIEIQVRTTLQHVWAELSEKYSDVVDPAIKYGGGTEVAQKLLNDASKLVGLEESIEGEISEVRGPSSQDDMSSNQRRLIDNFHEAQSSFRQQIQNLLRKLLERVR